MFRAALTLALIIMTSTSAQGLECDNYLRARHVFGDPVLGVASTESFIRLEALAKEGNGTELLDATAKHLEMHGIAFERVALEMDGTTTQAIVITPGQSRLGIFVKGTARRGWKAVYAPEHLINEGNIAMAYPRHSLLYLSHEAMRNLAPTVSEVHEARHLHLAGKIAKGELSQFDYFMRSNNPRKALLHGDESYFSYVHSEELSTYAKEIHLDRRRENLGLYAGRGMAIASTAAKYLKSALSALGARERVTVNYQAESRHASKPMWFAKIQLDPHGYVTLVMTIQEADLIALLASSKQAKSATKPEFDIPSTELNPGEVAALQSHLADKITARQQSAESWAEKYRALAYELQIDQPLTSPRIRKAIRALQ